jgi:hypothetical protein
MKSYSARQYGTLHHIQNFGLTFERAKTINQITLWSLAHRGYLKRSNGGISLTRAGQKAFFSYRDAAVSERKVASDLTARVSRLLRFAASRSGRKEAA